jgi:predicted nuclease of predicted toxin-antitoxin system
VEFMADENIPTATVDALRSAGHDVLSIAEEQPGSPDDVVLDLAVAQSRILITFDTDFGRFLHSYPFPGLSDVMLLRFPPRSPEDPGELRMTYAQRKGWLVRSVTAWLRGVVE